MFKAILSNTFSRKEESAPCLVSEPISSLSNKAATQVFSELSTSRIALIIEWVIPKLSNLALIIKLWSKPQISAGSKS